LVEAPCIFAHDNCVIDEEQLKIMEEELLKASLIELPEGDEDF